MRPLLLLSFLLCVFPSRAAETPAIGKPLPRSHAHNDYEHPRPLLDALSHGFVSVEADIHLRDGKLLVAHDADEVREDRTLERLYLDPLLELTRRHWGRVYPGGPPVLLLIDIKTSGPETYQALQRLLKDYTDMLTRFERDHIQTNAVTVIISGNRPRDLMEQEPGRLAGYDGRLADLEANLAPSFAPLISDNWNNHFTWRGEGEFPETERGKLEALVQAVHAQGKMIRFWAVPDHEPAWRVLYNVGVDLINTDRLADLESFLRRQSAPPQ